ncbi:MAG: ADP-ribosylglycohydrolase family protein [Phycisphaerae bacterium]|jgi:hypothetical protein
MIMKSAYPTIGVLLMLLAATGLVRAERTITAADFADKLHGMWLGQLIGVSAGAATEGQYSGADPNPADSVPWVLLPVWVADDDTDIEYLVQHVYLTYGFAPTPSELRDEWLAHVPLTTVWIANRQARYWMGHGLSPPETGAYDRNVNWWGIDPQLTTESIGAISPGQRQWAIEHVADWARITTEGHPVHAAQFYGAMFAAGAFEDDVPALIEAGLAAIPQSSRTAAVVRDVIAWHAADLADGTPDWRATRQQLYDHYQGGASFGRWQHWVESTINVGATTLALLYGDGSFEDTVQIAVLAGWDCDCNGATAGGLLGMIHGYSGLPVDLTAQCGDVFRNATRPDLPVAGVALPQDDSILAICQRWQMLTEAALLETGGWITGEGVDRTYHIADETPLVPEPELWDPADAAGLVGELRSEGAEVIVSASVEAHAPQYDRYDLEGVADGVVDVRYNGHKPYWTRDGDPSPPPAGEFYAFTFPRMVRVDRVVFYEGDLVYAAVNQDPYTVQYYGGYFTSLAVEVCRGGQWFEPPALAASEPLDQYRPHQVIAFDFAPQWCTAVRIRGDAGGTEHFTTILELEAWGAAPPPPTRGDLNGDGAVDNFDISPFVLALVDPAAFVAAYPDVNPYIAGDINEDGAVDNFDIAPFVHLLLGG